MKIQYIQGLKGLAMLIVVMMHFYLVFNPAFSYKMESFPTHILVNGNLAVCMFLLLSGFVISKGTSKFTSFDIVKGALLKRYFRILFPTSIVVIAAYIMYLTQVMHIQEIAQVLDNSRIEEYYTGMTVRKFLECLLFVPLGKNALLLPCWMLIFIYMGTMLIYLLHFATNNMKTLNMLLVLAIVAFVCRYVFSVHYCPIVIGMAIEKLTSRYKFQHTTTYSLLGGVILLVGILLEHYSGNLWKPMIDVNVVSSTLIFLGVMFCVPVSKILETRLFVYLGQISFSLFLVHWPIICSLSCWLFLSLPIADVQIRVVTILLITLITSLVVAHLYNKFVEPVAAKLCDRVVQKLIQ